MKQLMQISALPLLKGNTAIIERDLVDIETTSIRPKFGDVLRREVKNLSQFPFALPDLLFRPLCCGDVRHGTYKFEVVRGRLHRTSYDVEMFDRTVRFQQTIFKIEICPILGCAVDSLPHMLSILGMNSLKHQLQ